MTIAKTDARKQYAGDGVTTAFSFPYRFFDDSDLQVYILDASNVETLQTLTTDYTVANNGDETGGTVTMVTSPASGETLTILRAIPQTQSTDYQANDAFPAETHEAALDRVTLLVQQLKEEIGRAIIAPASDSASLELPVDRASSFLAFDADKNPIASAGTTGVLVSSYMETLLDDTTPAAARATLEIVDGGISAVVDDTTPQLGGQLDVNGQAIGDGTNELLTFTEDPSAVNHVNIENEATGNGPIISSEGDDTDIDLKIQPKGTGRVKIKQPNLAMGGDVNGDMYYRTGNETARLARGTAGQVLTMNAGGTLPEWAAPSGGWQQIDFYEPTTDVSEVTFTGLSGNGYRSLRLHGILQTTTGATPAVQIRAAAGTWRTVATLATTSSAHAVSFDLTLQNWDGAAATNLIVVTGMSLDFNNVIDRSSNSDDTNTGVLISGYTSYSETYAEIRLIPGGGDFEGSNADRRGVVILEAI